ncbi:MAG: hypothetical protein GY750_08180 [Lentisphaerae bacterium]|nr:hypothetical protein [Lentisphaerota bacterium]MCP4101386.1 hypothetical protein [Lentisphaerota bacterium]
MRFRLGTKKIIGQHSKIHNVKYNKFFHNGADINLDVPFVFQSHVNLCVDSCIFMIKLYKRKNNDGIAYDMQGIQEYLVRMPKATDSFCLSTNPRGILSGLNSNRKIWDRAKDALIRLTRENLPMASNFRDFILLQLSAYGPLMIFIKPLGHGIIIKGIVKDKAIVHDPWRGGNIEYNIEQLKNKIQEKEAWHSKSPSTHPNQVITN